MRISVLLCVQEEWVVHDLAAFLETFLIRHLGHALIQILVIPCLKLGNNEVQCLDINTVLHHTHTRGVNTPSRSYTSRCALSASAHCQHDAGRLSYSLASSAFLWMLPTTCIFWQNSSQFFMANPSQIDTHMAAKMRYTFALPSAARYSAVCVSLVK